MIQLPSEYKRLLGFARDLNHNSIHPYTYLFTHGQLGLQSLDGEVSGIMCSNANFSH